MNEFIDFWAELLENPCPNCKKNEGDIDNAYGFCDTCEKEYLYELSQEESERWYRENK